MSEAAPGWLRRCFPRVANLLSRVGAAVAAQCRAHGGLIVNPCRDPELGALARSPWLERVWQGLDPAKTWDCHTHLAGIGDSAHGLSVGSLLTDPWHPVLYSQRLFYLNAACVACEPGTVDENYVRRLVRLVRNMPAGFKAMLLAFDWFHDDDGKPVEKHSTFYVPNEFARKMAAAHPDAFEWIASIHPYRPDAIDRLEAAVAQGARAVKWLPPAQNIDPASKRCDAFYAALARLNVPLLNHCGAEKAAQGVSLDHLGNPLRVRRALEAGVKVVVAHCASLGEDDDLDHPGERRASFELFARLMEDPAWKGRLFGDVSAITLRNRGVDFLKTLLEREDWHDRLLNGSDYPLPGMPIVISPASFARAGLLPKEAVADLRRLREHNALYFDFALKRLISWQGKSFPARVFETRPFFEAAS